MSPAQGMMKPSGELLKPLKVFQTITSHNSIMNSSNQETNLNKSDYKDFTKMMLPEIKTRKLEDLNNHENPFKVIKSSE